MSLNAWIERGSLQNPEEISSRDPALIRLSNKPLKEIKSATEEFSLKMFPHGHGEETLPAKDMVRNITGAIECVGDLLGLATRRDSIIGWNIFYAGLATSWAYMVDSKNYQKALVEQQKKWNDGGDWQKSRLTGLRSEMPTVPVDHLTTVIDMGHQNGLSLDARMWLVEEYAEFLEITARDGHASSKAVVRMIHDQADEAEKYDGNRALSTFLNTRALETGLFVGYYSDPAEETIETVHSIKDVLTLVPHQCRPEFVKYWKVLLPDFRKTFEQSHEDLFLVDQVESRLEEWSI